MGHQVVRTFYVLIAVILASFTGYAQAPQYTIADLGGNTSSLTLSVAAINRDGRVVGTATSNGQSLAFRTAPNSSINLPGDSLGTLGGSSSTAWGINTSGQVVGESNTAAGASHAFRTAPNAAINPGTDDLGTLGGVSSRAVGINDSGQVVGQSATSSGRNDAFVTAPNSAINPATDDIGALTFSPYSSSGSSGLSINSAGHAAGFFVATPESCPGCMYPLAYEYQNGTITEILGFVRAPQGNNLTPINDANQVVDTGNCSDPSAQLPCTDVWQNGTMTSLAQCDCETHGLNNSLQVVGQWYRIPGVTTPNPGARAFLYTSGQVYDLNVLLPPGSGWVLVNAVAINDSGQIIGTGQLNGVDHVFRMDPVSAAVRISPGSLVFGAQALGTTSAAQFVTVTNTGSGALNFSKDTVSGDFALAGLGSCGPSLAPGANCTISIHFTPTAAGTRTGNLTIADNAPNSPQTVSLSGIGGPSQPAVSLSPASLTFSAQALGTTSSAQFVTVTNTGSAPLTFTQDTVSGDFALAGLGSCGPSLAPGANCTISIHFTPTAVGKRAGTLTIADNAPNNPQTVSLTGIGGRLPRKRSARPIRRHSLP
ncbi:MAG TPA: choice-of-anchor D domain-containing protein [Bryobacteraceae bacterium]|jgi:probable HAF family extracellular repeat protein